MNAGLLAEFTEPEALMAAAEAVRRAGYSDIDAFSPFPIPGLARIIGVVRDPLPVFVFVLGAAGALIGFGMQYLSAVAYYPINVGGRPYNSWPAFVPVTFEMAVLFAALTAVIGMLALNGLPRLRHPVFTAPAFLRASQDRYFLWIAASDPLFDATRTRDFLVAQQPETVIEVEHEPQR
jgi:hypothetical protein